MADRFVDFHGIADGRNLLVLTAAPGDESLLCGGLIAEACARGRPPFVAVLTDGGRIAVPGLDDATPDGLAALHAQQTIQATECLGVPHEWFVVLGLYNGTVPTSGPRFSAVVNALGIIMWRRDCNVVAVPWAADKRPDYAASHAIGVALATGGVGLVTYATGEGTGGDGAGASRAAVRLKPTPALARRVAALAKHPHVTSDFEEYYFPLS